MTAPDASRARTVAAMIRARADDDNVGLVSGEQSWTWREVVAEAATRAAWLQAVTLVFSLALYIMFLVFITHIIYALACFI